MLYENVLLKKTLSEWEVQQMVEKFGQGFKENRLSTDDETSYVKTLLLSPFEHDHYSAIDFFNTVIRTKDMDSTETLDSYVGLIVGYIKIKDFDRALLNVELCRQLKNWNAEQLER
ncbi:hypothetical protein BLA29_011943, partial [Euroglyphus maynei]